MSYIYCRQDSKHRSKIQFFHHHKELIITMYRHSLMHPVIGNYTYKKLNIESWKRYLL